VQDVTYYSKAALYDAFKAWRHGGLACSGRFDEKGAWKSTLTTRTTRYDQGGKKMIGVERVFDTRVFEGNAWGLEWFNSNLSPNGLFPQYYKHVGEEQHKAWQMPSLLPCSLRRIASLGSPRSADRIGPGPS